MKRASQPWRPRRPLPRGLGLARRGPRGPSCAALSTSRRALQIGDDAPVIGRRGGTHLEADEAELVAREDPVDAHPRAVLADGGGVSEAPAGLREAILVLREVSVEQVAEPR